MLGIPKLCSATCALTPVYVVQKRLAVEYERWQQYLDTPTRKPLIAIVEDQLLKAHMTAILDKGFNALMAEKRCAMTHIYLELGKQRTDAVGTGASERWVLCTVTCWH